MRLRAPKLTVFLEVLLHLAFWAFLTFFPIINSPVALGHRFSMPPDHFLWINLFLAAQFYLNAFLLIPVFINKRKQLWLYLFLLVCSLLVINFLSARLLPPLVFPGPFHYPGPSQGFPPMHGLNLLPLLAITAASFAYRYMADHMKLVNQQHRIANAALVSELAFLRSQISPHFIFNVINSVVALSRLNPSAVEPTLIQLSKLMRYMLYINDNELVRLGDKEDYLRSYIELQQLRFQNIMEVTFHATIASPEKTIEPMLLIPFVENAFKHGNGAIDRPFIDITLLADNDILILVVENAYNPLEVNQDKDHGIGLANVRRRLQLLYPGAHELTIISADNRYRVNLKIHLK
jgi:two-component system LytT family sensor kinase